MAKETAVSSPAKAVSIYPVLGVLQQIDPSTRQVTIAHEAIPGYMEAMTMVFSVRDDTGVRGLRPGDSVTFHLHVTADDAWIEGLRKNGGPSLLAPAPVSAPELLPGDHLPEIELINQRGEKTGLRDFQGGVLAFTFIYTRCPLPTYCPLINHNFQVAQTLLERLDAAGRWRFLSISIDAAHDTPEVLAAYAQAFQVDVRRWTFAVAEEPAVQALGAGVGLEFNRRDGQLNHNLRTVVLDAAGRIRHIFRGNGWTPQELAAAMRAAAKPLAH